MLGLLPITRRQSPSEVFETFSKQWPLLKRVRRELTMPLFRIVDTGLFGLTPLRKHILVCGFPRSGTTMLQLMLENGIPDAKRFGRETGGWRAATFCWRNHAKAITKVPHDVFRLAPLRQFYAKRNVELKIILMLRDPRDVLTSRRKTGPSGYVVSSARWRRYYEAFKHHQHDRDVIIVRYEDLVADVENQQTRIEDFTGETMAVPFSQFCQVERPDFDTSTLNGLRPIEQTLIARWSTLDHHQRIQDVLRELPELPQALIDLSYESDTFWTEPYTSSVASLAQNAR